MGISFHCTKCKKKIKAPDNAGGKYGACPTCGHRCYIPRPHSKDEVELKLIPIDPNEQTNYAKMMRESYNITQNVMQETAVEEEDAVFTEADKKELVQNIIIYLRQVMIHGCTME